MEEIQRKRERGLLLEGGVVGCEGRQIILYTFAALPKLRGGNRLIEDAM
jgi:hypothetical protein